MKKLIKTYLNTETAFIIAVAIFEIFHVQRLFGGAELLTGGDNYIFLQLGKINLYPYMWDLKFTSFGGINVSLPNLLGIPFYSYFLKYLPFPLMERVLIFFLYFFRYIAFIKLIKLLSKKLSYFSLIPALILFSFNAFETLNPFSLFPLMYSIYLPFSLYYFLKLYLSNKFDFSNIFKLIILSIIFSPINSNIALGVTIFIPQILFIFYNIKNINRYKIINICTYILLLFITSLWWFFPLVLYFLNSAKEIFSSNWFSATGIGNLGSNFRFIGQWGWYGGHFLYKYYPFSKYYDNFFVIVITYSIALFSLLGSSIGKINDKASAKVRSFFILLIIVDLFFINGSGAPFGMIYNFLYNYAFGFKIFREPFTKFGEIYVLSLCILFYFSLEHLRNVFLNKFLVRAVFFILTIGIVFVAIKPSFLGDHVWSKWNGSMRTFRVDVPDYWKEFENYVKLNINNSRILTTPRIFYGASWNWPRGVSSADDIAVNFIGNNNNLIRNPLPSVGGRPGAVLDNFFNDANINPDYVGLLGADYVLQENDLDWRYSPVFTYSPDKNTKFMENLDLLKIAEFGRFTDSYMSKIANEDPEVSVRDNLYPSLLNKPALVLYRSNPDKVLPKIYVPKNIVYSTGKIQNLPSILNYEESIKKIDIRNVYFIDVFKSDVNKYINENILNYSDSLVLFPKILVTKMNLKSYIWDIGWSWPEVNISPSSYEYAFVTLQERINLFTLFDNMKKIDLLAWYSSKRVEELKKYPLSSKTKLKIINILLSDISYAVNIIEKTPVNKRDSRYWEVVSKFNSYAHRTFGELSTTNISLVRDSKALDRLKKLSSEMLRINGLDCGELCYRFQVPEDGKYNLFINGKLIKELYLQKENPIKTNLDTSLYMNNLDIGEIQNFGETGKFAQVKDWKEDKQYRISFDYKTDYGKLTFVVVEELKSVINSSTIDRKNLIKVFPDTFITNKKNKEIINNTKYCSFVENGLCYTHYEKVVKASKKAQAALFLFEFNSNTFPIKNIHVNEVGILDVRLVKEKIHNFDTNSDNFPKIDFTMINPTKYLVHVSNAKTPYFLVFNETFNSGWKLYKDDKSNIKMKEYMLFGWFGDIVSKLMKNFDTAPKTTLSTYFNGDILEKKGDYVFIDSHTFETWGRKDIVSDKHYIANGFANSWLISPNDVGGKQEYNLILDFWPQRIFILLFILFAFVLTFSTLYIFYLRLKKYDKD